MTAAITGQNKLIDLLVCKEKQSAEVAATAKEEVATKEEAQNWTSWTKREWPSSSSSSRDRRGNVWHGGSKW